MGFGMKVVDTMNRYETEELILSMAVIVVENRQLRQEVKRLSVVEKEYHDYVMEQCRESEKAEGGKRYYSYTIRKYLLYDGKTLRRSGRYCIIMSKIV